MKSSRRVPVLTLALLAFTLPVHAGYELFESSVVGSCSFHQADMAEFETLLGVLRSQLEKKINDKHNCRAHNQALLDHTTAIRDHFSSFKPAERERIARVVYKNRLVELNADYALNETRIAETQKQINTLAAGGDTNSSTYRQAVDQLDTLKSTRSRLEIDLSAADTSAREARINFRSGERLYNEGQENLFRANFFSHVKGLATTLNSTDPKCIDQMGGWSTIMPAVLTSAAYATGFSGFAGSKIVGAALDVVAAITSLFHDRAAKKAVNEIIKVKDAKILACTYYAMRNATCEFKRAYGFARNAGPLSKVLRSQGTALGNLDFERYFKALEDIQLLYPAIENISIMGTALTFDSLKIQKYFDALKINPNDPNFPELPADATADQKTAWLDEVGRRGVITSETTFQGDPLSIDQRVQRALQDIELRRSQITLIEDSVNRRQSFVDLRHGLVAKNPGLLRKTREIRGYLELFLGGRDLPPGANPKYYDLNVLDSGGVADATDILKAIIDFLEVNPRAKTNEEYKKELDQKGRALFDLMATRTLAQITEQSVLLLSSKVIARLNNAFGAIESHFVEYDVKEGLPMQQSFAFYKVQSALAVQVNENLAQYTGSGTNFRLEEFETGLKAFETGFGGELNEMLQKSLDLRSEILPELEGHTAAHLCALFSSSLKKSNAKLWKRCQTEFSELPLFSTQEPSTLPINWNDACYYSDYQRTLRSQKILFEGVKQFVR